MAKTNRVLPRQLTGNSKQLFFNTTKLVSTHGYHQMFNTEIRLIIFVIVEDGEAVHRQQKPGQELKMAQIMNSLLPNSDLNWIK